MRYHCTPTRWLKLRRWKMQGIGKDTGTYMLPVGGPRMGETGTYVILASG